MASWSLKEEAGEKLAATSRHANVSMCQRRDAPTSRHLVNREKSTSDQTSRRLNGVTSWRSMPQNHKKQWRPNFKALKNVRTGARKTESSDLNQWKINGKDSVLYFSFLIND